VHKIGVVYLEENLKQSEENLVKKTCQKLEINQKQLAEKVGISKTTISQWSNDNSKISKIGRNCLNLLIELETCKNYYKQ